MAKTIHLQFVLTILLFALITPAGAADGVGSTNGSNPSLSPLSLQSALMLYGQYKKRTLLIHPKLGNPTLSINTSQHTEVEFAAVFEKQLSEQHVAIIPDGEHFLMLVPNALTNSLTPRANSLARTNDLVPEMSLKFQTAPIPMVIQTYADMVHKEVVNLPESNQINCCDVVTFVQVTPLSREEICYALETLLEWRNIRIAPDGQNKLKLEKISSR
jgi:hypothetical protein